MKQPLLPQPITKIVSEGTSILAPGEQRTPIQANTDSHAAKVARMEAVAPEGYGGGIPSRIEEGHEPE
jgi:hypothetical protein